MHGSTGFSMEFARRIFEPRVRRLSILVGSVEWDSSEPRLWLMDDDDSDILFIKIDHEAFVSGSWPGVGEGRRGRYGSWQRYRYEVAWIQACVRGLGWTMTPEEAAVIDALEEYCQRAPARYALAC